VQELRVKQKDDPSEVANSFCQKHNLGKDLQEKIVSYIQSNMPAPLPDKKTDVSQEHKKQLFEDSLHNSIEMHGQSMEEFYKKGDQGN
jgi:hypothetical protein